MLSLSPVKLLIVLVVALILLGPDKLPQVARQLGAGWRAMRQLHERVEREVRDALPDLPPTTEIARLARSPVALLNQLADMPGSKGLEPSTGDVLAEPPTATDPPTGPAPTAELFGESSEERSPVRANRSTGEATPEIGTPGGADPSMN